MDELNETQAMDELIMVRRLLPVPAPPTPAVAAAARAGLQRACLGRDGVPRIDRRSGRFRHRVVVTAAAACGAAVLAVVTLVPGSAAHSTAGAGRSLQSRSVRGFLLDMALRVSQARTGRYWCTGEVDGWLDLVGAGDRLIEPPPQWPGGMFSAPVQPPPASAPAGYQYAIMDRLATPSCLGLDGTRDETLSSQELGASAASPADWAAWRRDGSPNRWLAYGYIVRALHARGGPQYISMRPGPVTYLPTGSAGAIGYPWGSNAALPTSPTRLRAVLLSDVGKGSSMFTKAYDHLFGITYRQYRAASLMDLALEVMQAPVLPAVRAAAYLVLADIPGMQMRPEVKDPDGRTGTELWLNIAAEGGSRRAGAYRSVAIVDPATGYLLDTETISTRQVDGLPSGTPVLYSAFTYRWTNTLPRNPCMTLAQCTSR
jgi:hypothetical protein